MQNSDKVHVYLPNAVKMSGSNEKCATVEMKRNERASSRLCIASSLQHNSIVKNQTTS